MAFENCTIAPVVGDIVMCKHVIAAVLSRPVTGKLPRQRVEALLSKHKDDIALAKRAWKGFDLFNAGSVRRLPDGTALVNGAAMNEYHVHDNRCECMDWLNGYSAHIHALQASGKLPNPPVG